VKLFYGHTCIFLLSDDQFNNWHIGTLFKSIDNNSQQNQFQSFSKVATLSDHTITHARETCLLLAMLTIIVGTSKKDKMQFHAYVIGHHNE